MTQPFPSLSHSVDVGGGRDVEAWRLAVPGRGACYALEDADGRPVLLATVGNLRAALVRRLGPPADDEPKRKIDYRTVTRRVRYRPVFSRFEADCVYLENVIRLFPKTYRRLIRRWKSSWLHVDPHQSHPRFIATDKPTARTGQMLGPAPNQRSARRLIELLEELFDLCRYHEILVQSPRGAACAYKEMGKCPAPCDGTVSMDDYRRQIDEALAFVAGARQARLDRWQQDMAEASAKLAFERAGQIKARLERAAAADAPDFAHLADLSTFRFLCVHRGSRKGRVRVMLATPGRFDFLGETTPKQLDAQLDWVVEQARQVAAAPDGPIDTVAVHRLGLVSWHLFNAQNQPGELLRLTDTIDVQVLGDAIERIWSKPAPAEATTLGDLASDVGD